MKRRSFTRAAVRPEADGFAVFLDADPLLTPGGRAVVLPCAAAARAVAGEWESLGGRVAPGAMPLTRLAITAIDTVAERRSEAVDTIVGYAETDPVCYRVSRPEALRRRQEESWNPLLDWLEEICGARLVVVPDVAPRAQPAAALARLRRAAEGFCVFGLAALHAMTAALGSAVVALALAHRRLSVDAAFRAALVEELHQAERWGEDAEAEARRARLRGDLETAHRFFVLCR